MNQDDIDRFWSYVDKSGDCWIWQRSCISDGYGHFGHDGGLELAHRFAYRTTCGEIPKNLNVCHRCDNPPCVRPDHLYLATQAENMRDAMAKGRWNPSYSGERNPRAILTETAVQKIRELYRTGDFSLAALGQRFGVSKSTVYGVISRKTWKHIQERRG